MKDVFVGRQKELRLIRKKLIAQANCTISLYGEGGIGKTCLAQKAIADAQGEEGIVTLLVDFDLLSNRSISVIRALIVNALGGEHLREFQDETRDLEESVSIQASQLSVRRAELRIEETFRRVLNDNKSKRLLLIFDTFEKIQEGYLIYDILSLVKQLPNVLVVICGRKNQEIENRLQQVFGHDNYLEIKLAALNANQTREYIDRTLDHLKIMFGEETFRKIWLLTGGKPILLDLAIMWMDQSVDPKRILATSDQWPGRRYLELPEAELEKHKREYRARFANDVVDGIKQLRSPIDLAVVYMSLIDFPCSVEMWQFLMTLTKKDASQLMETLSHLFFVRQDFTLHDEMRVLVSTYVLPSFGGNHDGRRKQMIDDLYQYVMSEQPHSATEVLENDIKRLLLLIELDQAQAEDLFYAAYQRETRRRFDSCQRIIDALTKPDVWERLNPSLQQAVTTAQAKQLNYRGDDQIVRTILRTTLDAGLTPEKEVDALCTLAYSKIDDDLNGALVGYRTAFQVADQNGLNVKKADVLNYLGMVHRRLGDYEAALDCFQQSIKLYEALGLSGSKADTQNNQAYTYRLMGHLTKAMTIARMAFTVRKMLRDQRGLAYSYRTIGEIYNDQNELGEAEECFLEARRIFLDIGIRREVGGVDVLLANIRRKRHDPENAEKYLSESLEILQEINDDAGLSDAYNEYGCEFRKRGAENSRKKHDYAEAEQNFRQAEEYLLRSIHLARRVQVWYRMADSLSDLVLLYRYWYENCTFMGLPEEISQSILIRAHSAAFEAIRISRKYGFGLSESRSLEALGDFQYVQGKFFRAFSQYYLPACLLVASYYGQSDKARYNKVFNRIERRILSLDIPPSLVRQCASYMARRWKEEGKDAIAPEFSESYEHIAETWDLKELR